MNQVFPADIELDFKVQDAGKKTQTLLTCYFAVINTRPVSLRCDIGNGQVIGAFPLHAYIRIASLGPTPHLDFDCRYLWLRNQHHTGGIPSLPPIRI